MNILYDIITGASIVLIGFGLYLVLQFLAKLGSM